MPDPQLIALDWGTSNLRASLLDARGQSLETRSAPGGVMAVQGGQFAQALLALCADWLAQTNCPLMASGMIGSRQGWREAPYLDAPTSLVQAARQLITVPVMVADGHAERLLHIAPGLRCLDSAGEFDVMRGEETQIWGADLPANSCCVLPGTHSKWAWLGEGGAIRHFKTFMTGELYGVLMQHSILGRLMVFGAELGASQHEAFAAGVRLGLRGHAELPHTLFAARTAGLMGRVAPQALPDFLSGILLGAEIGGATAGAEPLEHVTLIGDEALCQRYALALEIKGLAVSRASDGATTRGQWLLAGAAGLLGVAV
ncbi:MAG: 2-dehydro-3-deoxygalactonokinase [Burkholderiales bacterium]|nr:2-dehydro-3-deoxygalactonokinase [Burkholderiales bacterium]